MNKISAAQIQQAMRQLPACAQKVASSAIEASGCGLIDIKCLCTNEVYLTSLQTSLVQMCDRKDRDAMLGMAGTLCVDAVPSLRDSRQPEVMATLIFLITIAIAAVILRLISRRLSAARLGTDDALIILSLIFTLGLNATSILGTHYGYGLHTLRLSEDEIEKFAKANLASQALWGSSVTAIKFSILFMYHRIFAVRSFTRLCIVTGVIMILWWIALATATMLQCQPFAFFWDKSIPGGRCIDLNNYSYGISASNILTDFIVLLLPVPWLWGLQLRASKKIAIGGIFLLGSFACVAGIVRIPLLHEMKPYDVTWTIVGAGLWINVECNIGIVSACLPVMRPLFSYMPRLPKTLTSRFTNSKLTGYDTSRSGNPGKSANISNKSRSRSLRLREITVIYPEEPLEPNAAGMGRSRPMSFSSKSSDEIEVVSAPTEKDVRPRSIKGVPPSAMLTPPMAMGVKAERILGHSMRANAQSRADTVRSESVYSQ